MGVHLADMIFTSPEGDCYESEKKTRPCFKFCDSHFEGIRGLGYEFKNKSAQLQDETGNQKVTCKRTNILKYYCADYYSTAVLLLTAQQSYLLQHSDLTA